MVNKHIVYCLVLISKSSKKQSKFSTVEILKDALPHMLKEIRIQPLSLWECCCYIGEKYYTLVDIQELLSFLRLSDCLQELQIGLSALYYNGIDINQTFDNMKVEEYSASVQDFYYHSSKTNATRKKRNNTATEQKAYLCCNCLEVYSSQNQFMTTRLIDTSSNSIRDNILSPCTYPDCVVIHMIVFRLTESAEHSARAQNTERTPALSTIFSNSQKSTSELTSDIILSLSESWNKFMNEFG